MRTWVRLPEPVPYYKKSRYRSEEGQFQLLLLQILSKGRYGQTTKSLDHISNYSRLRHPENTGPNCLLPSNTHPSLITHISSITTLWGVVLSFPGISRLRTSLAIRFEQCDATRQPQSGLGRHQMENSCLLCRHNVSGRLWPWLAVQTQTPYWYLSGRANSTDFEVRPQAWLNRWRGDHFLGLNISNSTTLWTLCHAKKFQWCSARPQQRY